MTLTKKNIEKLDIREVTKQKLLKLFGDSDDNEQCLNAIEDEDYSDCSIRCSYYYTCFGYLF